MYISLKVIVLIIFFVSTRIFLPPINLMYSCKLLFMEVGRLLPNEEFKRIRNMDLLLRMQHIGLVSHSGQGNGRQSVKFLNGSQTRSQGSMSSMLCLKHYYH